MAIDFSYLFEPNMNFLDNGINMGPAWEANPNNPDHWIYNQEVGWREKTWEERQPEPYSVKNDFLDPVVGEKILHPVGKGTASVFQYIVAATPTALKFIAIGVGAGAAATVVWNSMQVVKKVAQS